MRTAALLAGLLTASPALAQVNPDVRVATVFQHGVEIGVVVYEVSAREAVQTWYLYPGFEAPTLRNRADLTVLADPPQPDAGPPDPVRVLALAASARPGGTTITSTVR